ncbi:MAG: hypothetical protein A2286_13945 [Gammaproteobacteria bacterium RIFOXYA12_FULL_61_12]|nr:MAG: hypothetical protein A2286_13945 [Gammaproteobacteria bacterium RIFOXYA12_FULL_61_12]OGT90312.1 MAG: hypothetical protein A2514_14040 [Gammaproteobacteria bacterium RIFOXYD12_FULL_61_37]
MQSKNLAAAAIVAVLGTFASVAEEPPPPPKCDVAAVMAEAQTAQKKAQSVGGEWRDLGKALEQAAEAAAEGDCEKAVKKYASAKSQGELGYQQALDQAGAGNPEYLSK